MDLSSGRPIGVAAALLCAQLAGSDAMAQASLVDLSLEELGHVTITSAAKREQRLADVPTSLFVITNDDIRRAGVTRLPEALRLAPNLHVAQVSNGGYAISARGFNGNSANKLLVLIDGRSVYTPLFGGVFWDVQDVPLEDVERIEVRSGPGSTLWGVNAVNGVINIIMRKADATRGTLVSASAGSRERSVMLRHGWALGNDGDMRVYVKHGTQRNTETADGTRVDDAGRLMRAGFRADWGRRAERFALLGNAYRSSRGQPLPGTVSTLGPGVALGDIRVSGANMLARWVKPVGAGELSVQGYLDHAARANPPTFDQTLNIADLEVQYTLRPSSAHILVVGANHRRAHDRVGHGTSQFAILPGRAKQAWTSLYAQDEIALREDLRLTLGARIERNDYTGPEFLPSMRLAWQAFPAHLWWASAVRTARAPSRLDRDLYLPGQPPFSLTGGANFRAETANVLELGYRGQPLQILTLSATAFNGDYDHLRSVERVPGTRGTAFGNGMRGRVSGLEAWGSMQVSRWLRLHGGVTLLRPTLKLKPGSTDSGNSVTTAEGAMPRTAWRLRAAASLPYEAELDVMLRHVAAARAPDVPAYTNADVRLSAPLAADVDVALTARNVLGSQGEFGPVRTRSEFGRSLLLQLRVRFL